MTATPTRAPALVLVVDDQAANRDLLRELLDGDGYLVVEAADAAHAFAAVEAEAPDLILLDVGLPDLSGIEVCRRLKAAPATAAIPVIMVTALAHREDRLRGIEAGANDYLTKPIDGVDLLLRVRNALSLRRIHRDLEEALRREHDLEHLRDTLVHMLVHDLRSPLTALRLTLDVLRDDIRDPAAADAVDEELEDARALTARVMDMVNDVVDARRLEQGALHLTRTTVDLQQLAEEAVSMVGAHRQGVTARVVPPPAPVTFRCDAGLVRRVVANLVANAVDFSRRGQEVVVGIRARGGSVRVEVRDDGPGIPSEAHQLIFDVYGQAASGRARATPSSGLGLAFCRLAVEAHHGHIGVRSAPGEGSTFWFEIPLDGQAAGSVGRGSA